MVKPMVSEQSCKQASLETEVPVKAKRPVISFFILVFLTACSPATPVATSAPMGMDAMDLENMPGTMSETGTYAPLVMGFFNGGEVQFIHTEASDPDVASMLTEMMGGPQVVLVPELAGAPDALLANVYVFTNGMEGMGPFGFQPDIFDAVPGDGAYRPLRRVNLVTWAKGTTPRELRSEEALRAAEAAGEVSITQPGIVVNMPILAWPGGHR
jgi:hypothetical protein